MAAEIHDLDLRLLLVNPVARKRIKELMITSGDDDLMMYISIGDKTSGKLAISLGAPVQSVSARLERLYRKGYLTRNSVKQESGGYEWEYSNLFEVVGVNQ